MKIFRLLSAIVWAIPAYFLWNYLAPIYGAQLPAQYLDIPYWHIAGAFVLITILKIVIFPHRRHHFSRQHMSWKFGPGYFNRYAKYCKRGYWTEKYYHRA